MSSKIFILILSATFLISCGEIFSPTIKGNGKIVEKTINLANVNEILNSGIFNVIIKQGDMENARIETDENIMEYVSTKIENNKCSFITKDHINYNPTKANIYINLKKIQLVTNSGTGNINIIGFSCQDPLKLINTGTGNCNLNATITHELSIENNGVGTMNLNGRSNSLFIDNSGVGNIDAYSFMVDTADIQNNGVGSVNICVSKLISVSNNGVGNISYKGNPIVKEINKNGIGTIKKVDN